MRYEMCYVDAIKFREDDFVRDQFTWQPQGTSLQQFLRRATILKTLRGRRGLSASRRRSHRVYNTVTPTTLYQRLLRLRWLLHGASSPQLPPALTDALVPQVQVWERDQKKIYIYSECLVRDQRRWFSLDRKLREYRFLKKNKEKRGRKTHRSASRPSGLNDRKHLSLPCARWHDIFLFTHR